MVPEDWMYLFIGFLSEPERENRCLFSGAIPGSSSMVQLYGQCGTRDVHNIPQLEDTEAMGGGARFCSKKFALSPNH